MRVVPSSPSGIPASGMKTHGGTRALLWRQAMVGKTPAWSLSGCVTLGMFLNFSELLCPHPMNGENEADWPGWGQSPAPPSQGKVMRREDYSLRLHPDHPALLVWVRSSSLCVRCWRQGHSAGTCTPHLCSAVCACMCAHMHIRTHIHTCTLGPRAPLSTLSAAVQLRRLLGTPWVGGRPGASGSWDHCRR